MVNMKDIAQRCGVSVTQHPAFLFRNAGCLNYTGSPRYSESLSRQFSPSV